MGYEQPRWIVLILRPAVDAPIEMPPGEVSIEAPLHPRSHPAEVDEGWQVGFPLSAYVKAAEPVSYKVALGMISLHEWFEGVFVQSDYTVQSIVDRSQNDAEIVYWTVLNVRLAQVPNVIIQVTLRHRDAGHTTVTYRAEQHPVPDRDPASFLPTTVQRVDVEYTLLNGPQHTVRRVITDRADIRRLVDLLNTFPRDIRSVALGRPMDRWANLRFVTEDDNAIGVYVDPAHDCVVVEDFPTLSGTIWSLLTDIAAPDRRMERPGIRTTGMARPCL